MPHSPLDDPTTLAALKSSIRRHLRGIFQLRQFLDSDDVLQNILLRPTCVVPVSLLPQPRILPGCPVPEIS